MNKTVLILKHEFTQTIRRKSFIIITLAFPVLALVAVGILLFIQSIETTPDTTGAMTIGYVDNIGIFSDDSEQTNITFIPYASSQEATDALLSEEITAFFVIPPDYMSTGAVHRFTLERELEAPDDVREEIRRFLMDNLLSDQADEELTERIKYPLYLYNTRLDETGNVATDQGGIGAFIVPYLFSFLLLIAIFNSSGFVLQSLGEEKEYRIMEILLSSVSAYQLLTGKILALGAAGLVQMFFWLLSARLLVGVISTNIAGFLTNLQIPVDLVILSMIYFILGYLLFAILMAVVGSIAPTAREGQQLSVLFTMTAVLPFMFAPLIIENANHIVVQILTVFPLTAPLSVMIRLGVADIPSWQLTTSIILLILSVIGSLILGAKVFRTFLLMYGKRPALNEIIRSLRQA